MRSASFPVEAVSPISPDQASMIRRATELAAILSNSVANQPTGVVYAALGMMIGAAEARLPHPDLGEALRGVRATAKLEYATRRARMGVAR